jgi:hypothetical protein
MGHDISAYVGTITPTDLESVATAEERGDEKIAYLRGSYGIYEALDATFYDGKVSGIGIGRWFPREQLRVAEQRLVAQEAEWQKKGWSCELAIQFIRACLERLPPNRNVCFIWFG